MFGLFKVRHKVPQPIFESLGIDMHCHLLPRVDDGSQSETETLTCLRIMKQAGFHSVILTPHYQVQKFRNVEEDILERFETLKLDLKSSQAGDIPNLVDISGEYRVDSGFQERLATNKFRTINNRFLLAEYSLGQQVMGLEQVIFDLQMKNHEIILAHPERYPYFSSVSPALQHLKNAGVYFQVNILSLLGFYGPNPKRKAYEMIEQGWVEFLGTDLHNVNYAQALIDCTYDRKIEKLLATHKFMNSQIMDAEMPKTPRI